MKKGFKKNTVKEKVEFLFIKNKSKKKVLIFAHYLN